MLTISTLRKKMINCPNILCMLYDYADNLGMTIVSKTPDHIMSLISKQRGCDMAMFGNIPYDGINPNSFNVESWKWAIEIAARSELNDDLITLDNISVTPYGILLWWSHPKKSQKKLRLMLETIVSKFKQYDSWSNDNIKLTPKLL